MNDEPSMQRLFEDARKFSPFGETRDLGFETRLRASLAGKELSLADCFARFSWRFSAVCFPAILGLAIFLTIQHHTSLPEGVGGLVAHWMEFFPL